MNHSHHKYSLGSNENTVAMRARSTFGSRSSSPAAAVANAIKVGAAVGSSQYSATSPAHTSSPNGLHTNNANGAHSSIASTSGSAGCWSASIEEAASSSSSSTTTNNIKNFVQSHSCCYHCQKHQHTTAAATENLEVSRKISKNNTAMINGSSGGIQTIEDQIRAVDKIIKECDNSRKNLEQISRRLDDLSDEVKRYREFLGHEKSHRDPTVYKTVNSEPPSPYNDNICGIMSSLTFQLTKEWSGKLTTISTALHTQTPSTPGSKMSDRN